MSPSTLTEIPPFNRRNQPMSVVLVDDDESLVEMSSAFLQRELDNIETTTLTDPTNVLNELQGGE